MKHMGELEAVAKAFYSTAQGQRVLKANIHIVPQDFRCLFCGLKIGVSVHKNILRH